VESRGYSAFRPRASARGYHVAASIDWVNGDFDQDDDVDLTNSARWPAISKPAEQKHMRSSRRWFPNQQ
jgi:hypothetical protein